MNTIQLLDAIRHRHKLPSDYAAAAMLGVTRSQISKYRNGEVAMGDEVAQRAAALVGADPAVIVAQMHAQRASDPQTRKLWVGIAKRLDRAGMATAMAALLWGFTGGPDAGAMAATGAKTPSAPTTAPKVCILCKVLIRGFSRFCAVVHRQLRRTGCSAPPPAFAPLFA